MLPPDFPMRSYQVNLVMALPSGGRLVLFESYPTQDVIYTEIWGREVFRFDENNRPVWQIEPEPGASDDMQQNFDAARPSNDSFTSIYTVDGRFYASRSQGDTFLIDTETGRASYSGWART